MEIVENMYDVAIVGGGAAELSTGAELSKLGHKALAVKKVD